MTKTATPKRKRQSRAEKAKQIIERAMKEDGFYRVTLTGNTFPYKEDIVAYGYTWNDDSRAWEHPAVSAQGKGAIEFYIASGIWRGVRIKAVELTPAERAIVLMGQVIIDTAPIGTKTRFEGIFPEAEKRKRQGRDSAKERMKG